MDRETTLEFIDLVEKMMEKIDEEMEHGKYGTPDNVPEEFEDEEDYYGRHEEITDEVVALRIKVKKMIKKLRENNSK